MATTDEPPVAKQTKPAAANAKKSTTESGTPVYRPFEEVWAIVLGPTSSEGTDLTPELPDRLVLDGPFEPVRVRLPLAHDVTASSWPAAVPKAAEQVPEERAYGTFWMPLARYLPEPVKRKKRVEIHDEFEEVKRT